MGVGTKRFGDLGSCLPAPRSYQSAHSNSGRFMWDIMSGLRISAEKKEKEKKKKRFVYLEILVEERG